MAEAATATAAPAPAAESKSAPPPPSSTAAAPPPAAETTEKVQSPAQEPPKPNDDERRAQRIAAARRESARVAAEREAITRERAQHAEDLKLASEYRRLAELQKKDPLKYMDEVGLKVGEVSKLYLQQGNKTPEQIAEEVYERRRAKERDEEQATSTKAQEQAAIQAREAAYAGARNTLERMIADGGQRFETLVKLGKNGLGDVAVDKAFKLIEAYHSETKQILDFGKALDAIEAKFKGLAKADEVVAASKPVAEVKAASGSKSAPKVEADVSEGSKPSTPQPIRRMTPRDQKRIAQELVRAAKAAQDT